MTANKIYRIGKNGQWNIYTSGRFVNTLATKGIVQKADDGYYYEETIVMVEGVPTKSIGECLGESV